MRYYDLAVTNPSSGNKILHYTSYPNGQYDPGALNIEYDLFVAPEDVSVGNSTITISGIPSSVLTNAKKFTQQRITLKAGMGKGLPLATPSQAGLILQGQIFQSFGNWVGTQLDISFVVLGSIYTLKSQGNLVLNWLAGQTLAQALTTTLQTAYPQATVKINIADIVMGYNVIHFCATLGQLAQFLIVNTSTQVRITIFGSIITVQDNTYKPTAKQLSFTDFVGQPMWIAPNMIQLWCVTRADIQVGDYITMPQGFGNLPGFVQTTSAANPSYENYTTAMQGKFVVHTLRQLGNLRDPQGTSWCTVINAAALTPDGIA